MDEWDLLWSLGDCLRPKISRRIRSEGTSWIIIVLKKNPKESVRLYTKTKVRSNVAVTRPAIFFFNWGKRGTRRGACN